MAVPDGLGGRSARFTTIGLILLTSMLVFNGLAVAVTMPIAVPALGGMEWYGWGFTGYFLLALIGNALVGILDRRVGPSFSLVAGTVAFMLGLLVSGVSSSMGTFVLGRALQGLGAGVLSVCMLALVAANYPAEQRAGVLATTAAASIVPAVLGPPLAGTLAELVGWRSVFLAIAVAAALALLSLLPTLRRRSPHDSSARASSALAWYAVVVAVGFGLAQFAGERLRLGSLAPLALGGVLVVVGLPRLLPRGTFRRVPGIPALILCRLILAAAFFGSQSALTLALVQVHGYSDALVGLVIALGSVGGAAAAWLIGRRPPANQRLAIRVGFMVLVVSTLGTAALGWQRVPGWTAFPDCLIAGIGAGMTLPTASGLVLSLSGSQEHGRLVAALEMSLGVGASVAIAVQGTLIAAAEIGDFTLGTAITVFNLLLAAVATAGILLSLRFDPGDQARRVLEARPAQTP